MRYLQVVLVGAVLSCGAKAPPPVAGELPRIGLAVRDTSGAWCAEFRADSGLRGLTPGEQATVVFGGPGARLAVPAVIGAVQPSPCGTAFAQPRWIDYAAYQLSVPAATEPDTLTPMVALIVAGAPPWAAGPGGLPRADLDGDAIPEEVRRCAADEGEHFTVWSVGSNGAAVRRWHEYFDWGAFTDPTCRTGENGQ